MPSTATTPTLTSRWAFKDTKYVKDIECISDNFNSKETDGKTSPPLEVKYRSTKERQYRFFEEGIGNQHDI